MAKRKRVKTGDRGLYKQIDEAKNETHNQAEDDEDGIYSKSDLNFINKFEKDENSSENSEEEMPETVLDLNIHSSSDEDSSEDDDNSSDDGSPEEGEGDEEKEESESESSSSSEEESEDEDKVTNWGTKKYNYYHGDTADLELGIQEEDEAKLEEEAGREVLKSRYEQMKEEDFELFSTSPSKKAKTESKMLSETDQTETLALKKKSQKLNNSDKLELLSSKFPELLPIIQHFSNYLPEAGNINFVMKHLVRDELKEVGGTAGGHDYLQVKQLLLSTVLLNLTTYLMFISDPNTTEETMVHHPLMNSLNKLDELLGRLKDKIENPNGLSRQFESLVKAVHLMQDEQDDDDESDIDSDKKSVGMISIENDNDSDGLVSEDEDSDDGSSSEEEDEIAVQKQLMNDARFSVRAQDFVDETKQSRRRPAHMGDFGDSEEQKSGDSKGFMTTMNTIRQRQATAKKKKQNSSSGGDYEDEIKKQNDEELDVLAMMEKDVGPLDDEEDNNGRDDELNEDLSDDEGFYNVIKAQSQVKKAIKKSKYKPAPKYPTLEEEADGERAVTKAIMKNRGLVPHKPKIDRNPRVKKREQYRKALIRRKGAVREVRTGEVDQYGGEQTGIKSGLSRSRKIGIK